MPVSLLQRRPDSGLGNIRTSASAPGRNIDWLLMLAQAGLIGIGLATIYSASYTRLSNPFVYLQRQEIFLVAAVLVMAVVMFVDYDTWRERARMFYALTVVALFGVLAFAPSKNGARLSFDFGPLNVQPAEFAKVTLLLALATHLADTRSDQPSLTYSKFTGSLILIGIPAGLVILQPDLGSASVLVAATMGMLLVAGARFKHIALVTGLAVATVLAAVATRLINEYQVTRITVFVDRASCAKPGIRDQCLQIIAATRAVATGGITGKGWLNGPITNAKDVAVQYADFPFSAIGEQFGLLGGGVVIALFGLLLFRIWRIGHLSRDMFGTYICAGAFSIILWQVFQNIGMTIGLMPVTGLPLPLISYGGSGLVASFAILGLVQNVYMRRYR